MRFIFQYPDFHGSDGDMLDAGPVAELAVHGYLSHWNPAVISEKRRRVRMRSLQPGCSESSWGAGTPHLTSPDRESPDCRPPELLWMSASASQKRNH